MADFRAQRIRNERLRQARLKSSSSRSSSKSRASRRDQLIQQGLSRAEASQIANAEASGQKLTNIQTYSTKAQAVARSSGLEAKSKKRLTPTSIAERNAGRVFSSTEKSRLRFKNEERNLKNKLLGYGLSQSESTLRAKELAEQGVTASRLNLLEARQRIEASREREKQAKIKGKANFRGLIKGKVYTNLTEGEILNNKLNINTSAKLLPSQTSQRNKFVQAKANLEAGIGTTYDISTIATKGKGGAFGIQESKVRVLALLNKDLEKKALNQQKQKITSLLKGEGDLSNVRANAINKENYNYWRNKEKQVDRINQRSAKSSARREVITGGFKKKYDKLVDYKDSLVEKLFGKSRGREGGLGSRIQRNFVNKFLAQISTAPYDLTVGLGEFGGQLTDKTWFIVKNLKDPRSKNLAWEELKKAGISSPKEVARGFDPRTPEGLANIVLTLALLKLSSRKPKVFERLPRSKSAGTNGLGYGQLITDGKTVNIVGRGGILKKVNPRLAKRTILRAGINPEAINFRAKSFTRLKDGSIRVTSTGGKSYRFYGKQAQQILKNNKKGSYIRFKQTQPSRLTKKALKEPLNKSEAKVLKKARDFKITKQIKADINRLSRKYKLTSAEKIKFTKLYKKLKSNPTDATVKAFSKFSERQNINRLVRALDKRILKQLKKVKVTKPKVIKIKKITDKTPVKIRNLQSKVRKKLRSIKATQKELLKANKLVKDVILKKKGADLKLKNFIKKIEKRNNKLVTKKVQLDLDKASRKKGFKNYKEELAYNEAFIKLNKGNLSAKRILSKIEASMRKRKGILAKKRVKLLKERKDLILKKILKDVRKRAIKTTKKKRISVKKVSKKKTEPITITENKKIRSRNQRITEKQVRSPDGTVKIIKVKKTRLKTPKRVSRGKISLNQPKLKSVTARSVTTGLFSLSTRVNTFTKRINVLENKLSQSLTPATITKIKTDIESIQKILPDVIIDYESLIDSIPVTKTDVISKAKQKLKQVLKLKEKVTRVKNKVVEESKIPKKIKIKKKLDWDTKLPKGQVRLVNVLIKSKGKIKELKLRTTPNRAYKYAKKLTDNTLSRSFQLKIVGVGKGKDIKGTSFKKFRVKKSRGSSVLKLVEKSKYAIDTKGEKSGLTVAKALKKKAYRNPKRRK